MISMRLLPPVFFRGNVPFQKEGSRLSKRHRIKGNLPVSSYNLLAKSLIASDIFICCGQTASQLRQAIHAVGCFSFGIAINAIGARKPPPVKLCSLYRSSNVGMSRPCGQWLTQYRQEVHGRVPSNIPSAISSKVSISFSERG